MLILVVKTKIVYFQPQGYNLECDKTCPDGYYIDLESLSCKKCSDGITVKISVEAFAVYTSLLGSSSYKRCGSRSVTSAIPIVIRTDCWAIVY